MIDKKYQITLKLKKDGEIQAITHFTEDHLSIDDIKSGHTFKISNPMHLDGLNLIEAEVNIEEVEE